MPVQPPVDGHVRALCLLSGGLDSRLAACVLREQGIEVHGLVFDSPFFNPATSRDAAAQLEIPLHVIDFTADILALLESPPHGFGAGMNPCIDCHAHMLRRAGVFMEQNGFQLVASGEVLNQRPMSQNRRALGIVAEISGCADYLLRPLSAQLLPETAPERYGWVDRSRLLNIEGRNRKRQFDLAARYGLTRYPQPAGGCRLTEPGFVHRLRDLKAHEGLGDARRIVLLRHGRHVRLDSGARLVIGRNETDNETLENLALPEDHRLRIVAIPGPVGLLIGPVSEEDVRTAASYCVRYSDAAAGADVRVTVTSGEVAERHEVQVTAAPRDDVDRRMIQ